MCATTMTTTTTHDMDEILNGVLEEIKFSTKQKIVSKKGKSLLSKKNKNAIKMASKSELVVNTPQKKNKNRNHKNNHNNNNDMNDMNDIMDDDIKYDDNDEIYMDDSQIMMIGKNLGKLNNKNYKNMYYISHKILHNFVDKMIEKGHNIHKNIVDNFVSEDFNEIMIKFIKNLNKKNKKSLQNDLRCMGRKIDGQQCTRRKHDGQDYCQSHYKRLTNGRIDEAVREERKKNKRGRKRKVEFDPRVFDNDYVTVWAEIVDGERVLVDDKGNVYTFDVQNPVYLGKKNIDATLSKVPYTDN